MDRVASQGGFEPGNTNDFGVTTSPEGRPQANDAFDAQVRQLLSDLVSGKGMNVDTAEEEALIKQLMQDQIGQGLVEQRARMGRAGFGASGALAAMEGDVQRQAAQRATQETLATRRQAEQDAIERALSAVGVDVSKRKEGREAEFDEQFLAALQSAMGQENPEEAGGDAAGDFAKDVEDKGLIGAVPEALGSGFVSLVKTIYGPDANPADYTMMPPNLIPVRIR